MNPIEPLPIDAFVPAIVSALANARAVVVVAQPGAGKTTRVPPALIDAGPVIVLQPRRVAARAIVRRIAEERGWTIGREIGWQIRFERNFSADTRLLAATEGILTVRLQQDPLLSDFTTVVLDEFHERSLHADLAIALARQAWHARQDLRIVVMSATLDAAAVSTFLGGCPVVEVPGSVHPVDVRYQPASSAADAAIDLLDRTSGDLLVFQPGAFEIRRTLTEISGRLSRQAVDLVPLHGSLDTSEQDAALRPSAGRRRIVVATNVAETSVTVPGVTGVVDCGLHKVARYDAERAIDSLEVERITQDSAEQRAGRAGRTAPGSVIRLWDARDRLRAHREAEIHRVDLSGALLDIMAWGEDPRSFEWFEPPRPEAISSALNLLERLGAIAAGALTATGRLLQRLPLHPRLGRILIEGGGARQAAQACALLSERHYLPGHATTTSSDLLSALDKWQQLPPHVHRVASEIEHLLPVAPGFPPPHGSGERTLSDADFRRAILAGYPDRVAERRAPGSPRVRLSSGAGAAIAPGSGVRDGDFLVALDVHASTRPDRPEASIRMASRVEREWLRPTAEETIHRFDAEAGVVRAARVERYDALTLSETPTAPDPAIASGLLAEAWLERGPREADHQLLRRLRFIGHDTDRADLVRRSVDGVRSLDAVDLARGLDATTIRTLDRDAPSVLRVPSGRTHTLDYREDGSVTAAVKLQELFGLAESPRLGPKRAPVVFELLAPNGRPVQTTRDLKSFWERTYPEVRKELRGRYPKHPWPEDPWNAIPTAKSTRRPGRT